MNIEYRWEKIENIKGGEVFYYSMDDAELILRTKDFKIENKPCGEVKEILCVRLSDGSCEWFNAEKEVIPAAAKVVEL